MKGLIQLCAVGYQIPSLVSLNVRDLSGKPQRFDNREIVASGQPSQKKLHELGKTPINFENLRQLIGNYPNKDDAEILLSGFKFGFKINYYGPRLPVDCKKI